MAKSGRLDRNQRAGNLKQTSCTTILRCFELRPRAPRVGLEPFGESDVTRDSTCTCDFCQGWRAANALQNDGSKCPDLAQIDADLQRVISAWDGLPEAIRRAI